MTNSSKVRWILLKLFIFSASMMIILPLMIMILGSFKNQVEAARFSLAIPSIWKFENYIHVFNEGNMLRAFLNSIFITTISVTACLLSSATCGYIIARRNAGKMYNYFLLGMIAPFQVVTTFALLKLLNIMGSYLGVILVYIAINLPWSIFLFTSFIKGVPRQLDEAAVIDGCGPYKTFFTIIMPLLKPVAATNVVITTMSIWNDFTLPLYFLGSPAKWTIPLTVYNFFGMYFSSWNYVFANLIITALPVTIIYLFCQKYIVSGMTEGAIKG